MQTNTAIWNEQCLVRPQSVPTPETPAQRCALYGFTCLGSHGGRNIPFDPENNPILRALRTYGSFPSDSAIREMLPRPFLTLEGHGTNTCTMEEMEHYWRVMHRRVPEGGTPVRVIEITKLGPGGKYNHLYGHPLGSDPMPTLSTIVFNSLGYNVGVGDLVFVHNFEIAEFVPPGFQL
jgi:hypothetical protein